jgi:coenzyme F420-0:L-glutamate ligase/coenzyme F420-1:gamma-L-glutamate ligase
MRLEIAALATLPEITVGNDLAFLIKEAAQREGHAIDASVILAVAQKIVSKGEGCVVDLRTVRPSPLAASYASEWGKDPRVMEVVLAQSKRIVKMDRGILIAETRHGFVCANAGVDQSNTAGGEFVTILPPDPDASAQKLWKALGCGAVIITDTFGRPWREGLIDVAIGVAGLQPIEDHRGRADWNGRPLTVTMIAVADQLAGAAGLVMRKSEGCPVVLIRGFEWEAAEGSARALLRAPEQDLFR